MIAKHIVTGSAIALILSTVLLTPIPTVAQPIDPSVHQAGLQTNRPQEVWYGVRILINANTLVNGNPAAESVRLTPHVIDRAGAVDYIAIVIEANASEDNVLLRTFHLSGNPQWGNPDIELLKSAWYEYELWVDSLSQYTISWRTYPLGEWQIARSGTLPWRDSFIQVFLEDRLVAPFSPLGHGQSLWSNIFLLDANRNPFAWQTPIDHYYPDANSPLEKQDRLEAGFNRVMETWATPWASTLGASSVTTTSASLDGFLHDLGAASVNVSFQWGTSPGVYPNETAPVAKSASGYYAVPLSNLNPNTTYYYRAKGSGANLGYGVEKSFVTSATGGTHSYAAQWSLSTYRSAEDIAVDSGGYNYVAKDYMSDGMNKYSSSGTYLGGLSTYGDTDYRQNAPKGVGTASGDYVFLSDTNNHRVKKYAFDLSLLGWFGKDIAGGFTGWHDIPSVTVAASGTGDGQFTHPKGIATDVRGYVYVADSANHRVQKLSSTGTPQGWYGQNTAGVTGWHLPDGQTSEAGTGNGEFSSPSGVAIDSQGNLYVADTGNHRIQKINGAAGDFMGWFGKSAQSTGWHTPGTQETGIAGSGHGEFNNPSGVAIDSSGYIYVADTNNHRWQKFNHIGPLGWYGKDATLGIGFHYYPNGVSPVSGNQNGEFNQPKGVACDRDRNLYVADTMNWRVQKFAPQ